MSMAAILVMWPGPFELSFPVPKEAQFEIWLQSAHLFQRRRCLKMLTYIHTYMYIHVHTYIRTTEAYIYYKLTNEPKGSDELKKVFVDRFVVVTPAPWPFMRRTITAYTIRRPVISTCVYGLDFIDQLNR